MIFKVIVNVVVAILVTVAIIMLIEHTSQFNFVQSLFLYLAVGNLMGFVYVHMFKHLDEEVFVNAGKVLILSMFMGYWAPAVFLIEKGTVVALGKLNGGYQT
jgi:di/tricarboxylate transporter